MRIDHGLNGEDKDGEDVETIVGAKSIEKAIRKLRASLPKSLAYEIIFIENVEADVIC